MTEEQRDKDGNASDSIAPSKVVEPHEGASERKIEKPNATQDDPRKIMPEWLTKHFPEWLIHQSTPLQILTICISFAALCVAVVSMSLAGANVSISVIRWLSDSTARKESTYQAERSDIRGWISGPDTLTVGSNDFWVHLTINGKRPTRYKRIRYGWRQQVWGAEPTPLPEPDFNEEWRSVYPPTSFTVPEPIRVELTEDQVTNAQQMGTAKIVEPDAGVHRRCDACSDRS